MGHSHQLHGLDRKMRSASRKSGTKKLSEKETAAAATADVSKWLIDDRYVNPTENLKKQQILSQFDLGHEGFLDLRSSALLDHRDRCQAKFQSRNPDRKFKCSDESVSHSCPLDSVQDSAKQAASSSRDHRRNHPELSKKRSHGSSSNPKERKVLSGDVIHNMSNLPDFLQRVEKEDSFQDRALRFGVLDWSLLEKWSNSRSNSVKANCSKKRNNHSSSSGSSDTSSSLSTMGSSSFSCRSESSNCAKRETSPFHSSNSSSYVHQQQQLRTPYQSYSSPSPTRNHHAEALRQAQMQRQQQQQKSGDRDFASNEYLDFRLFQGKILKNQMLSPRAQDDIFAAKEIHIPEHDSLECASSSSLLGTVKENELDDTKAAEETGLASGVLPKEQQRLGSESPSFFSAGEASPETCSEMSINLEYPTHHFAKSTSDLCFEPSQDLQFHGDGISRGVCSSTNGESISRGVCASTNVNIVIDPSISNDFISSDGRSFPQNSVEEALPENPVGTLGRQVSPSPKHSFQEKANNLGDQEAKNVASKPPINPVHPSRQIEKTAVAGEAFLDFRNSTKRRSKSFCIAANSLTGEADVSFGTAKSFSVRPEGHSCQHYVQRGSCKFCKKPSVSPLRRWIDPLVKSKEKQRSNWSPVPVNSSSYHPGIRLPKAKLRKEVHFEQSVVDGFAAECHRNTSVRMSASDCQGAKTTENQNFSPNPRCRSPVHRKEGISRKLFDPKLDIASNAQARPANSGVSQGLLHFMYKSGLPYFTCSLNDSEEVFAAKTWKIDKSEGGNFDWIYSFHSGRSQNKKKQKPGWVTWGKKDFSMPAFVGMMRVSSLLTAKLNKSGSLDHVVETEFVLSGISKRNVHEHPSMECMDNNKVYFPFHMSCKRDSASDVSVPEAFPVLARGEKCSVSNSESLMASRYTQKREADGSRFPLRQSFSESCHPSSISSGSKKTHEARALDLDSLDLNLLSSSSFHTHLELAAISVQVPLERRESVKSGPIENMVLNRTGGWGLKFLEKISGVSASETDSDSSGTLSGLSYDNHFHSFRKANSSPERGLSSDGGLESSSISMNTSVSVLIPAGIHGLPLPGSVGPSSLIERWKSGGECDCGGWDIGCPLTVIDNHPPKNNPREDNVDAENFHPYELYIQGTQLNKPVLSLTIVHDGLYLLSFQEPLSALQAFSIGVAMLHSRDPLMSVKELDIEEAYSALVNAPVSKEARTLSQEICTPQDDFLLPGNRSHDIYSMHCVPDPPLSPFGRV